MVLEGIATVLDGVPLLRWAWRKLLERGLEVKFHHPTYHLPSYGKSMRSGVAADEPIFHVQVYPENPNIYCWMDCELINHRTDRQEVIQSSTLSLKRRHWYFWSRTLANAPFTKRLDDGSFSGDPLLNIRVQEMSPLRSEPPLPLPPGLARADLTRCSIPH